MQPSNPEPWLRLGDFQFNKLNQPAEALKSVRTALYLDPQNPQIQGAYLVVLRATQGG
jgi:cytochrome c-type biogenesis protein CcmH/NrfG